MFTLYRIAFHADVKSNSVKYEHLSDTYTPHYNYSLYFRDLRNAATLQ